MQTLEDLIGQLDLGNFMADPEREMKAHGLTVHKTLLEHMNRIKDLNEKQKEDIQRDLEALRCVPDMEPGDRRALYARLAERYRQVLGWEGNVADGPCW